MKIVRIFKRYIVILVLFPLVSWGNEDSCKMDACKEKLMTYLDKMEAMNAPIKGQVYHVKYQVKTTFNKGTGVDSEVADIEVFTTVDKIAIYGKKMNVFGDDKNIFVILPDLKKIYWNNSDPRIFNEANSYKKFLEIQRTLLNSAKTINCMEQDDGLTLITVVPSSNFAKQTKLLYQKVTYDPKEDRIVKVDIVYNNHNKIKSQMIAYQKLDFDSSKKIVSPIAVLFNGNELKSAYKGFEIIDNRKN